MLIHSTVPLPLEERRSDLAEAVLAELARHLDRLAGDPGYSDAIDLRSLPLGEADRAVLKEALGDGEVTATLALAGNSDIQETGFAGIWWVVHRGAGNEIAAEQIVVARVPDILLAHPDDVAGAAVRLKAKTAETTQLQASERQGDRS